MAVGQLVTKQTWLLDNVEVKGIVRCSQLPDGAEVGAGDDFDIEPDDNYKHLIALFPANNPLSWNPPFGCIHLETYPLPPDQINRVEPWPIAQKPAEPFLVLNPATGQREPLKVGQHVRVVGRWTIDHHPERCVTRNRGLLRIGCAHTELHPFRWDLIQLVVPLTPNSLEVEIVSLAAPLHEEVYLGGGKWLANEVAGVASKIFITEDGSNYHNTLTANTFIKAPALPPGWRGQRSLIDYREQILQLGLGLTVADVRAVTVVDDGIQITATITAPGTQQIDGLSIGDVNDPANRKSVFQARYAVGWLPRLDTPNHINVGQHPVGSTTAFQGIVTNRGPDPVHITTTMINPNPGSVFQFEPLSNTTVPAGSNVTLKGKFVPTREGTFSGTIVIGSNDPAHAQVQVQLSATTQLVGRLQVSVEPRTIPLGRSVQITVRVQDNATLANVPGKVRIYNFDQSGNEADVERDTNTPFTITFYRQKEFDPELRRWRDGEYPSGTVSATADYELDRDTPIPFKFA